MDSTVSRFTPPVLPRLCIHKRHGAYVRLEGRFYYLGQPGAPSTDEKYRALCAHVLITGHAPLTAKERPAGATVRDVVAAFRSYSERRGVFSSYAKRACTELEAFYGSLPVAEIGPLKIKAMMYSLSQRTKGEPPVSLFCRKTLNSTLRAVKTIFRYGVSEELVPAAVLAAVSAVGSFHAGELGVRESVQREAVPDDVLKKTVEHCVPMLGDILNLLRLTGARPSELLGLTPGMIDRSGPVWFAKLDRHKTAAKGKGRYLAFGPKSQALLAKYLFRAADGLCFTNSELAKQRNAGKTGRRDNQKPNPRKTDRKRGELIVYQVLEHEIVRATKKAGIEAWLLYGLRHAAGTEARAVFGLDGAQARLGHSNAKTSEIYSTLDLEKAQQIAAKIG